MKMENEISELRRQIAVYNCSPGAHLKSDDINFTSDENLTASHGDNSFRPRRRRRSFLNKTHDRRSPPKLIIKKVSPPKPAKNMLPPQKPECPDCEEWYHMVGARRPCDRDGKAVQCRSGRCRRPNIPPNA